MKRTTFLLTTAVIALMFGAGMILLPNLIASVFGLANMNPSAEFLLRCMGTMYFSMGIANYIVRNQTDSVALKAILIMNITYHILSMGTDIHATIIGTLPLLQTAPAHIVHLFVAIGSFIFLKKLKTA